MINDVVIYILKVNACFALLYILYLLFLKELSFYVLNRIYLLSTIGFAIILPLLPFRNFTETAAETKNDFVYTISNSLSHNQVVIKTASACRYFSSAPALSALLALGVIIFALLFAYRTVALMQFVNKSSRYSKEGRVIVHCFNQPNSPFSFWNRIFLNPGLYSPEEFTHIVEHEKIHIQQYHTIDILSAELFKIICWFNPLLWKYARSLRQNLEYIADNLVLKKGVDPQRYQLSLLGVSKAGKVFSPVNFFAAYTFKKRLFMMNRTRPSSRLSGLKYTVIIPAIFLLAIIFNSPLVDKVRPAAINIFKQFAATLNVDNPKIHPNLKTKNPNTAKRQNIVKKDSVISVLSADPPEPVEPVKANISIHEIPPGANWHAEMTGDRDVSINILNDKITLDGQNGMAIVKNRSPHHPTKIILRNYPDAIFFYNGKEYPLNEFADIVPVERIWETDVYLGSYSAEKFGITGKDAVVIFRLSDYLAPN